MDSNALVPASQYLRMSTEHQRYSLENQSSAIEKYAENHGFSVIQTYSDAARTGVVFRRRKGLQQLIQDVVQRAAVSGVPITEYCDKHRLPVRERLELFIRVCDGVQHAHQKAVIHRDLKPSNILVVPQDDKPVPKIIDFGLAKAMAQPLTDRPMFTEIGAMVGTPGYMSPEQADMTERNVDTRTDVYSLGVVLYELLVGDLPFDAKELREAGFVDMLRKIREEDPQKPSTKVRVLGEARIQTEGRRGPCTL